MKNETKTGVVPAGKNFRVRINGIVYRNIAGDYATFKKADDAKDWLIDHLSKQLWLTNNRLENIQLVHSKFEEAKHVLFGDLINRIDGIETRIDRLGRP